MVHYTCYKLHNDTRMKQRNPANWEKIHIIDRAPETLYIGLVQTCVERQVVINDNYSNNTIVIMKKHILFSRYFQAFSTRIAIIGEIETDIYVSFAELAYMR